MSFCKNCGKEISENSGFCAFCGAPVIEAFALEQSEEALIKEEQAFLDMTNNLLRWERKAWSITSIFFLIAGICFTLFGMFFTLVGISATLEGEVSGVPILFIGVLYLFTFASYIAIGIIQRIIANKMPTYLNSLYYDFTVTKKRCTNVGMIVLCVLFNMIAFIFFIINFVRIQSCDEVVNRIIRRQNEN